MKTAKMLTILVLALGLMVCSAKLGGQTPMGTAITYQGRLIDANEPADGDYDFTFTLYDEAADGNQVGSTDVNESDVIDGYFRVELDFGSGVFDGNTVWLEIGVRAGELSDPNVYVILSPRQKVTPAPYAVYADVAGALEQAGGGGIVPRGGIIMWSGSIDDIPNDWALCDGNDGTPDLRDRFIVGARQDDGGVARTNVKGSLMQTGGEHEHRLTTAEMPSHTHEESGHGGWPGRAASDPVGAQHQQQTGPAGGDQPHENCPPFYALAFIMKT